MAIVAQVLVTRASIKPVMAIGDDRGRGGDLVGGPGARAGNYWAHLAGPLFLAGVITWGFVPVSIGALTGVRERDAGVASGLIDSSQQLGGAIGIAVASTVAASHSRLLLGQGQAFANALTGGFHWAFAVCGFVALASVPVALLLVRRAEIAPASAGPQRPARQAPLPTDIAADCRSLRVAGGLALQPACACSARIAMVRRPRNVSLAAECGGVRSGRGGCGSRSG